MGVETGVWIEGFAMGTRPAVQSAESTETEGETPAYNNEWMIRMKQRYGAMFRGGGRSEPEADATSTTPSAATTAAAAGPTNEISVVTLSCRAVSLKAQQRGPQADLDFTSVLQSTLHGSSFFVATNTAISGNIVEELPTFKFNVTLKLKRPIKL